MNSLYNFYIFLFFYFFGISQVSTLTWTINIVFVSESNVAKEKDDPLHAWYVFCAMSLLE